MPQKAVLEISTPMRCMEESNRLSCMADSGCFAWATEADLGTPLLSLKGDQGAAWQLGQVNYSGTNEIQFVFQGSYSEMPEPGLAVDSVRVWQCEETFTQCDFNNASDPLCGWAQPQDDDGEWIHTNQPTPTEETGPPGDYPHGEGYYIYAEAGSLRPGQSMHLESQDYCLPAAACVEFYYYMSGVVHTETQLRVLARGPSGPPQTLWTRTSIQTPAWLLGAITIPAGRLQPTKIIFEVVRGNLPYLDVALDNLSVRRGPCPEAPATIAPSSTICPSCTPATGTIATSTTSSGIMTISTIATTTAASGATTNATITTGTAPGDTTGTTTRAASTTPGNTTETATLATGTALSGTTVISPIANNTDPSGTTTSSPNATETTIISTMASSSLATTTTSSDTTATTTIATGTAPSGTMTTSSIVTSTVPSGTTANATIATGTAPSGTMATSPNETGTASSETTTANPMANSTTHSSTTSCTLVATGTTTTGTMKSSSVATGTTPSDTTATTTIVTGTTSSGTTANATMATSTVPSGTMTTIPIATGTIPSSTATTSLIETSSTTTIPIANSTVPSGTMTTSPLATSITPSSTTATTTIAIGTATSSTMATTTIATGTTLSGTTAIIPIVTGTASSSTQATTTQVNSNSPSSPTIITIATATAPTSGSPAPSVIPSTLPGTPNPCPPNAHYEACGPACPPRCNDSHPSCSLPCQPGCQCNPGHLLSGEHCVPHADCGCFHNHTYYQPGEIIYSEDCLEICQCLSNNETHCSNASCGPSQYCASHRDGVQGCFPIDSAACVASGDPHYTTFDKRKFDFQGTCTYVLARPCNASLALAPFAIYAENENRFGQNSVAYVRALSVELPGTTIALLKNHVVQVNGSQVTLPAAPTPGVSVYLSGTFAEVRTDFGMVVRYDGNHYAEVRVSSQYWSSLCGLCGDYDGDPNNDFQTPMGDAVSSAGDFGDSWSVGNCTSSSPSVTPPCPAEAQLEYEGPRACGILLAPNGPFSPCHSLLSPMTFFRDCVFDLCAGEGDRRQLCAALGNYGAQCQDRNLTLGTWRNQTFCPLLCPPNSHYEACGPACPAVCPEAGVMGCQGPCLEGCQCDPGFLLSGGSCVPQRGCGCSYRGRYYQPGEEFFSLGCGSRCRCEGGNRTQCQAWQCHLTETCGLHNGQYGCHPTASAPCYVSGDPHYQTFDRHRFDFMGTCTYTLARPCGNYTGPWFSVEGKNEARGRRGISYLRKVYISLPGTSLTLLKGKRVLVNGTRVTLPAKPTRDTSVAHSGHYVAVQTLFGLAVRWDGNHYLEIQAPSSYSGLLCGLCGNYDGNSNNDNLKPDGQPATDGDVLGNSWQTPDDEDPECQPDISDKPVCTPDSEMKASCEKLQDPQGAFRDCHKHISPTPYFENCLFDMCQYQGLQESLCAQLQAYTAACQAMGATVFPWRGPELCPLECPANSSYALCAQLCPETCSVAFVPIECPAQRCVEGCDCLPGFVLSGQKCVPASQCGCTVPNGGYHPLGDVWLNADCSEKCTCQGQDAIHCQAADCQPQESCQLQDGEYGCHPTGWGSCVVAGDPHYTTFDGRLLHFMGTCSYTLSRVCDGRSGLPNFTVEAANEHRGASAQVSYVRAVAVEVYGHRVALLKGRRVTVDGQRVTLPVALAQGQLRVQVSGAYALLQTDFGLRVRYDGTQRVEVQVPSSYAGQLCGLCGNYNGQNSDDNLMPNGTSASNVDRLGESWMVPDASSPGCTNIGDPGECDPEISKEAQKPTSCGALTDPQGPFAPCHGAVPPADSFKTCHYDLCGTWGETTTLCYALQSYADGCAQAGIPIAWRNSTLCPLNCPPGSTYTPCASPCPSSCTDLGAPNSCLSLPCVEACACNEGYILSGDMCVPLSQCGCTASDGRYHLVGESWMANDHCTERCTCMSSNNISCEPWSCSPVQQCQPEDGLLGCQDTGVASCHVAGDPHYFTFDGAMVTFQGTCTYTLVSLCSRDGRLQPFNITGKNEERGQSKASYLRLVHVELGGTRFTLMKNRRVLVDGERVRTPVLGWVPGVSISTSGIYTELRSQAGLLVRFDGNQHLEIQLSGAYFSQVCGMCGNYNNQSQDDLALPSGHPAANATDFGNSWQAPGDPDPGCQPDNREDLEPHCSPLEKERFSALCREILAPKYQACHGVLPPQPFIQSCLFDMCEYQGMVSTLCDNIQVYAEACKSQGVAGLSWRNSTFCPLPCPPHSHYTECASPCPATCTNLYSAASCPNPAACVEGCACNRGYVLSDETCVDMGACGCLDDQQGYHSMGDTWLSSDCSQRCTCLVNGSTSCQLFQCQMGSHCALSSAGNRYCKPTKYYQCTISGDPHYRTFDGYVYHFQGRATYTLTTTLATLPGALPSLSIMGRNRRRVAWHRVSFLREVYVSVYGYKVTMMEGRKLVVDGLHVTPPFQPLEGLIVTQKGRSLFLQTDFGLSVSFNGRDHSEIVLPTTYQSYVGGLCGNFDGRRDNEYTKPDGTTTRRPTEFGESWAVRSPWSKELSHIEPPQTRRQAPETAVESGFEVMCSADQLVQVNGTGLCGTLADPQGPFQACHGHLDPSTFQENCVYDVCAVPSSTELLCQSLSDYAQQCQALGLLLPSWRQHTGCAMACPAHTTYQPCMTACPASCAHLAAPSTCDALCVEGCASDPGYVLSNLDSVPYNQCGCSHDGQYYPINQTFLTTDCTQRCTCQDTGTLQCEPAPRCLAPDICTLANYTWGCYRASPCLSSPCQNEGWCRETDGGFTCDCAEGYEGQECERVTPEVPPESLPPPDNLTAILVGVLVPLGLILVLVTGVCLYRQRRRGKTRLGDRSSILMPTPLGEGDPMSAAANIRITQF
ncbi:zonadhesin [Pelodiscus sinensis]|uniref:zonadhesin n=1 Tax=Pelodiscus sinensis TaxID=13735 RepID=UPI003F6C5753